MMTINIWRENPNGKINPSSRFHIKINHNLKYTYYAIVFILKTNFYAINNIKNKITYSSFFTFHRQKLPVCFWQLRVLI